MHSVDIATGTMALEQGLDNGQEAHDVSESEEDGYMRH